MAAHDRKYLFDTSAIVNLHQMKNNNGEWDIFVLGIKSGNVRTIEKVFVELRKWEDTQEAIKKERPTIIQNDEGDDVFNTVGDIMDKHEELINQYARDNDQADPWLIAIAKAYGYVVVTDERRTNPKAKRRIPYVAIQFSVESISLREYLDEQEK